MKSHHITLTLLSILLAAPTLHSANWPNWRGPNNDGTIKDGFDYPSKWDKTSNVRWRTPLPAEGNSSPVIWEDYVITTQSLPETKERTTMCLRRSDGKLLWQNGVTYEEEERTWQRPLNPYCSGSEHLT